MASPLEGLKTSRIVTSLQQLGFVGQFMTDVRPLTPANHRRNRLRTCRARELLKLAQIFRIDCGTEPQPHKHRAFTAPRALEHSHAPRSDHYSTAGSAATSPSSPALRLTLRAGTTVEMACLYTI